MGVVKAGCSGTAPLPDILSENKCPLQYRLSISIKVNVCTFIYWFDITILQNYWAHLHTDFLQIDSDVLLQKSVKYK